MEAGEFIDKLVVGGGIRLRQGSLLINLLLVEGRRCRLRREGAGRGEKVQVEELNDKFFVVGGEEKVLKEEIKLEAGELIDASFISKKKLCQFFEKEINDCKVSF